MKKRSSIGSIIMLSFLRTQIAFAEPTAQVRDGLDQRFRLPIADLPLQALSCKPLSKAGTEIYKFIISNGLLNNPEFREIGFSSTPYWEAYQHSPNDLEVSLKLGDAYLAEYIHSRGSIDADLETRFYRDAIAAYQNALALPGDSILKAFANLGLGRILTLGERYEEAIEYYQAALQIAEKAQPLSARENRAVSADAYVGMGVALGGVCKHDEALEAYLKAVELNPDHPDIDFINLSALLEERNRLGDMVAVYKRAIQRDPNFFGTYASLGSLLEELGNVTEAISNYRRAIALEPNSSYLYYDLGNALAGQGNLTEALTNLRRAAQLAPDDAEIQTALQAVERRQ